VDSDIEIVDADHEEVVQRVAAIDVAKASGMLCTRLPHPSVPTRRITKVRTVSSTTNAIITLANELAEIGIDRVVVESTSDYWRPFFYLLEARGLDVWLVNARDVKHVPGRPKTDKLDAVWLAKLAERGMLRPSFVPPAEIRHLRDYTRLRTDLVAERTRHVQRLEKLLEDALIKLSTVASDIMGVSGRQMIEALIAGERDPAVLAGFARGKMRDKRGALKEALTGRFDEHHAELAQMLLDAIDSLSLKIEGLTTRIDELIAAMPASQASPPGGSATPGSGSAPLGVVERLDEIAGIGPRAAQIIVAEIGLDMSQFPTPGHLVSWAKLSPRTIQSGAKSSAGKTGKGNRYLKGVLGEAATAAAKTNTFLGQRYRRLVKRRGKMKALVAIARSILVIVWHLLADPRTRYRDLGPDFYDQHIQKDRKTRSLVRQLQALGHEVTLTPTAA
jgi:transposase